MAIPLDHIIHFICFMSAKGKASRSISTYISLIIHVTIQSLNISKSLIATKLGGGVLDGLPDGTHEPFNFANATDVTQGT